MSTNPYASPTPFGEPGSDRPLNAGMPVAGIIFGVLHIVFGLFGICGTAASSLMFFIPIDPAMARQNPVLKLMEDSPFYRIFNQGSLIVGLIATLVLIAAGIGLLMQRPFGRQLSIGYGVYGVVAVILGTIVNVLFVFPALLENYQALPPGPEKAGAIGGIVGGVIGLVLGIIYPVLVLYFMYTPKIIAAYRSSERG
jgi:hypothetical protein